MSMRKWRKMAKNGNGRHIKQMMLMQEYIFKRMPKGYPLLDALFNRVGIVAPKVAEQEGTNEAV